MTDNIEVVLIEEINCCSCGIRFGIAQVLLERRRKDFEGFCCPNGHWQSFKKPPVPRDEQIENLKSELKTTKKSLREAKDELAKRQAWIDQLETSRRPLFRFPRRRG